ncbi:AAA ATPase [Flavobacterium limnosediminis JC2902]|uniref:AAA ATPase n=1 Tax=Flavobacterium limnosediminis JC2902 TaxID=1341181 RepID=V6SLQ1_9FLAO|nr:AAA family ATPase [Flavobacterium limnosediminis]ESU27364.1 AAA ATPase [Flavobacterium limnosediminis JC2902]
MIENDFFGLHKERKLKDSKVREIFTPHQPIQTVEFFCGREMEVTRIIEYLNTPGQHALVYGDRGVGKSSLANITCDLLIRNVISGKLYKKRCDSYDNFATILRSPLNDVDVNIDLLETQKTTSGAIGSDKSLVPILPSLGKSHVSKVQGHGQSSLSPSWVCEKLRGVDGILLIDEFDILSNDEDKKKIAELIKQLSDCASKFKLFIVGIAESSSDLTAGHPSVQRCLKETRISRMIDDELEAIILAGEKKLNLKFNDAAIKRIVKVSSGYPHFTHLLALKSAEDAILDQRKDINLKNIIEATRRAVDDSEGTLKQAYDNAVRSSATDEYKKILLAAACSNAEEIKASELRQKYKDLFETDITQGHLNNHFQKIVSEDNSNILRRIAKGVYRFNDPRMPSFIKIAQSFIEKD